MEYLVSIRLMTFMHEPFIKDAMDGIMMQQTKFKVEVVVGDDFSTDRTLEIIKGYQNKGNIHIRILDRKQGDDYWQQRQKLGRLYNFTNILDNCHGKYVAILDGDDYWTDPLKLQKQVDFLEENEDYQLCFHNVDLLNEEEGSITPFLKGLKKETFTTLDVIEKWFIPTASIVFNKDKNFSLPNWFFEVASGDQALLLLLSLKGKFKFINEIMGVYRLHESGVSRTHINDYKVLSMMYLLQKFNIESNFKYEEAVFNRISAEIKSHHPAYKKLKAEKDFEIQQLQELNHKILNSHAYKLGRQITALFSFLKPKTN